MQLDRAVDDALAGGSPDDPLVRLLVDAHRSEPPPGLAARVGAAIRRTERRRWLPAQAAAAVLCGTFLVEASGNLFYGRWLARHLDAPFEPHTLFEGGVAFLALAAVLLAGALARRWLDLAVLTGVPAGLALSVHGSSELGEFPSGGVLHLSQGVAALGLALLWWRARRYALRPPAEYRA